MITRTITINEVKAMVVVKDENGIPSVEYRNFNVYGNADEKEIDKEIRKNNTVYFSENEKYVSIDEIKVSYSKYAMSEKDFIIVGTWVADVDKEEIDG